MDDFAEKEYYPLPLLKLEPWVVQTVACSIYQFRYAGYRITKVYYIGLLAARLCWNACCIHTECFQAKRNAATVTTQGSECSCGVGRNHFSLPEMCQCFGETLLQDYRAPGLRIQ